MSAEESVAETPTEKTAQVSLGGRERELRFDMWSVCQLEELTGRPWHEMVREIQRDFGRANVRLVWACLQHESKPPTVREVAEMLEPGSDVFGKAFSVFMASVPKSKPDEQDGEEGENDSPLAGEPAAGK